MTEPATVTSAEHAATLEPGQWAIAPDGSRLCLVDTHIVWPQRMWMCGAAYYALTFVTYPMVLADVDGLCDHAAGTQECGHCRRCGVVVGQMLPLVPAAEPMRVAVPLSLPSPTPGPAGCTAGWADDPCTGVAEDGCDVGGYPACRDCAAADRSYWGEVEEVEAS